MNGNLTTIDYQITCAFCGKKMGVVSLVYIGVPHHGGLDKGCCIKCLPARLDDMDVMGYDHMVVDRIREWVQEENDATENL